jgi:hypothetical protein
MKVVKLFLKTFIGGPLLIFGPIVFIAMIVGEEYLIAFWTLVLIIAFFALSGWDNQRDERKLKEIISSRGINIDYWATYLDAGVVIDLSKEKLLVGNLKSGKILDFSEVKNIEWEDAPYSNTMKYNIYVNTNNFEAPRLGVGFAGHKKLRDTAYAKLSAALKCN